MYRRILFHAHSCLKHTHIQRERERERERLRETERDRERQRDKERDRETKSDSTPHSVYASGNKIYGHTRVSASIYLNHIYRRDPKINIYIINQHELLKCREIKKYL